MTKKKHECHGECTADICFTKYSELSSEVDKLQEKLRIAVEALEKMKLQLVALEMDEFDGGYWAVAREGVVIIDEALKKLKGGE